MKASAQDRVIGAIKSVKYHPGSSVLDTKTKLVKFNGNRMNGNEVLNKMR